MLDFSTAPLSKFRRLYVLHLPRADGKLAYSLVSILDVSQLPVEWPSDPDWTETMTKVARTADALMDAVKALGVKVSTYNYRGAFIELAITKPALAKLKPVLAAHAATFGAEAEPWATQPDPAWQPYVDGALRELDTILRKAVP